MPRIPHGPEARAILAAVAALPAGSVCSYGRIASRAGLPRRARLVGRVLATLPPDSTVPWHRVLRADGRLAFPAGSEAFTEQCRRLAAEGVPVRNGRVDLQRHGQDLDAALWGPGALS